MKSCAGIVRARQVSALLLMLSLFATVALAETVGNSDVVKLLKAGMSEDLILRVISSGDTKFDTSADALIALKKQGASEKLISAMINSGKARSSSNQSAASRPLHHTELDSTSSLHDGNGAYDVVTMVDDGVETRLLYERPGRRSKARALGLGGIAQYFVLQGSTSRTRTANKQPQFIVSVDANAHHEGQVDLARWEPRPNGTREILAGSAVPFGSISSGLPKERVVPLTYKRMGSEGDQASGRTTYLIQPAEPLVPGEYALVALGGGLVFEVGIDP